MKTYYFIAGEFQSTGMGYNHNFNKIGIKVGVLVQGAAPSGWVKVGGRLGTPGPGQAQLGLWLTETEGKCGSHRLSCS